MVSGLDRFHSTWTLFVWGVDICLTCTGVFCCLECGWGYLSSLSNSASVLCLYTNPALRRKLYKQDTFVCPKYVPFVNASNEETSLKSHYSI